MKLPRTKTRPARGLWPSNLKKVLFCLALSLPLAFYSCSGDNDEPDPGPDTTIPYSVTVSEQNKNMPSGGTITSEFSDSPKGSDVGKAVDNNKSTNFVTSKSKHYILWKGSKTAAINYYSLTSAIDAPEKDPKSWTLSGSNDNKTWNLLDTQTGQTFSQRQETKNYEFTNKAPYQYYKLEIQINNGGTSTQLAEWTMEVKIDPNAPYSVTLDSTNKNMPSAGIITSQFSDFPSGSDIAKIADNNISTNFITNHSEFYITWEGSKNAAVNYYSLTSAGDAPEKDPKSWTLSGSNDKVAWTTLDEQENQTFVTRKETKEYEFENKIEYKYYKLDIQSNKGDVATQIAEWRMEVIPTDIEDLMSKSGGSSYSSQTPMGNHYANRHLTTAEDRAWLKVAENEPPAPASASNLYLAEFPVNLFPYGKPLPADVNQHAIGNCGGVAALASMAYVYPDFVKSLIKDNGNNTYTVSMFDPQGKPVEVIVTSKFLTGNGTNIDAASGKNNTATWSTVLEKAVMKWNCIYKVNPDIGGIGSEHVPPLFTGDGNSFAFSPDVNLTAEQLARIVKVCLRQGYLVVGGFNQGDLPVDNSKTVTGHAYTLMHSADKSALFIMRNPWGGNPDVDGSKDGVLNIPNNYTIPKTIDLRITYPGKAAETGSGVKLPYIPPTLKSAEAKMRVADYLLRPTIRR